MGMIDNIAHTLTAVADEKKEETGLIEAATGRSVSFGELEELAGRYASILTTEGVKEGDRVILMVKPSAEFICLTFALFRIGAPVILIDPGMGYKNLLKCIEGVRPDFLIGIPKAIIFKAVFRKPFRTIKKSFCCGSWFGFPGPDFNRRAEKRGAESVPVSHPDENSLAAIIFTTGSTGPPKGVRFEHRIFNTQLEYIKSYYLIGSGDIDQPGFPLFGLFSIALGARIVIPDMDPTKPAQVDPVKFVSSIEKYGVTYSFGSPALWNVVSRYCQKEKIKLPTLKKVLMAGAPIPGELMERLYGVLPEDAQIFTPYGATESLPIVSIEGREVLGQTWPETKNGKGTCVGRPLPGIDIRIIAATDGPIASFEKCKQLSKREVGEIIVKGEVVTRAYENNEAENMISKIADGDNFWHRIGDMGYLDEQDRLWFCGRKAHRVFTKQKTMYTIPCESIINNHPDVFRSALVGVEDSGGYDIPVMIIERNIGCCRDESELLTEIKDLALSHPVTDTISQFLVHPGFPVDIRHNAKIFREKLSVWAQNALSRKL